MVIMLCNMSHPRRRSSVGGAPSGTCDAGRRRAGAVRPAEGGAPGTSARFSGSTSISSADTVTFQGMYSGDYFGWAVANAGDVDGDTCDDMLIGAYALGTTDNGAAYLIYGEAR